MSSLPSANAPGRRPKGTRKQSVSFPAEHHDAYQRAADELGIPFSTYVAWTMAKSAHLPIPEWIVDEISAGSNRRLQEELPMAQTA